MALVEKHILLVGSCGMGVAPLGIFLASKGYQVYGVDDYPNPVIVERLQDAGVQFLNDLHSEYQFDEIIFTRAMDSNPCMLEELRGRFSNAKFYYRGEYLAKIANEAKAIVIAGSHGKTSTTALLIQKLQNIGFPASHILGGFFVNNEIAAGHFSPESEWIVLEVDESDRTIELFEPEISVITNFDLDHVGAYKDEDDLQETFSELIKRTKRTAFCRTQDFSDLSCRSLKKVNVDAASDFIQSNLIFSDSVCQELGLVSRDSDRMVLVERRQNIAELPKGHLIVQDYAHHPNEIKSLLSWSQRYTQDYELEVVFQPHRYSRTRLFMKEFAEVLADVHCHLIPEYAAFEHCDPDASSRTLLHEIQNQNGVVDYSNDPEELLKKIDLSSSRKMILFVGAGDISLWADWVTESFRKSSKIEDRWLSFVKKNTHDDSYFSVYEDLRRKVTLNVGGKAKYYAEPNSISSLQYLLKTCSLLKIKPLILGRGSNLLIKNDTYDALVIRLNKSFWKHFEWIDRTNQYYVRAGVLLKEISKDALTRSIQGFNFWEGIPGTLGGAIRMNAGAMGLETESCIISVDCMDLSGKVHQFTKDELSFGYRVCPSLEGFIVLGAVIHGSHTDDSESLKEELNGFRKRRLATQPSEPSAGCMFKNPEGDSAGRLIDISGLKGFQIGKARISEKHGNFLVTERGATSDDVLSLIKYTKEHVKLKQGVTLEQEIKVF